MDTVSTPETVSLELDDLQSGVLHPRPSPYVGTYLLLRIDDRRAGRELVRRLHPVVSAGQPASDPARGAWVTVALTHQGLQALGVPQESLDSFTPEFRQGMAARAAELGDSSPANWERPLGTPDVHVALAALSPDAARLAAVVGRARRAHQELPGVEVIWRQDCYQLPTGRTSFGFKDGIGQPAVEGSGIPGSNPRERPIKAGEFLLGYPDETGSLPPMPTPEGLGRNGTYIVFRKLHTRVAAYRRYLRERASSREEEARLGAKMVGRWQSGAPLALSPDHDDPQLGADPVRNNDFDYHDDLRGFKCPAGAPAGRARSGGKRQRPPPPDDPARHQLRPDVGRRRPGGRWRRPRHHLRVRRCAPEAPVRVRQDPVDQRRHLHRRARRKGPAGRAERRLGHVHDPAAADPTPAAGPAAVHRHPRRGVLLCAGPASAALAGGAGNLTGQRSRKDDQVATSRTRTDRWKALDFGPPVSGAAEPDSPVLVEYGSGGQVALITLNRPHADNAITTEMGARLTEILETIAVRPAVRVAVITGAGDRAFSVGSDLRQRKGMTKEQWLRQRQDFDRTLYTLRQLRKPVFAAVNGIAYGGGCEIAQSTDFIIASDNAIFGQPEAMIGLAAGGGSPALLPRVLPPGRALQMLMTGDPLTAQEAYRLGMVNELCSPDELLQAAMTIATKIASNSPTAVQAVKGAVRMGQGQPIEQAVAIMMEAHWRSAVHPDRVEGIGAFNDDREPTFQDPDY